MKRILRGAAMSIGVAGRAFVALVGICGVVAALANYTMTQGAGTTFGSVVVGGFHYVQFMLCDLTTPGQCAAVSAAGAVKVDASATTQPVSAASLPLPTGASSSANQGTTADVPCTVPTSATACSEIAIAKAIANVANSATPVGTNRIGYTTDDPCNNASAKVYTPINVVTATNVIIAGVSAKKKYLCGIFLYPGGTDNVAIYQATTGSSCATALVSIFGGTTTGTGFLTTAQAGFVVGTGSAAFAATTVVNTDICITTSAAVQLSGAVVTADQ